MRSDLVCAKAGVKLWHAPCRVRPHVLKMRVNDFRWLLLAPIFEGLCSKLQYWRAHNITSQTSRFSFAAVSLCFSWAHPAFGARR